MRKSIVSAAGAIQFPAFTGAYLYMYELDVANPCLPPEFAEWVGATAAVVQAARNVGLTEGVAFLTIEQKSVKAGETPRRKGRHIDGNHLMGWGGGWVTELEEYAQRGCDTGGFVMAASHSSCDVWEGEWEGRAGDGGDCDHIDVSKMKHGRMQANVIYVGNHALHESVPADQDMDRSFIRLTLPHDFKVAA